MGPPIGNDCAWKVRGRAMSSRNKPESSKRHKRRCETPNRNRAESKEKLKRRPKSHKRFMNAETQSAKQAAPRSECRTDIHHVIRSHSPLFILHNTHTFLAATTRL